MTPPARRTTRRGSTLVEMMVTIAVLTVLLGLTAGLIRLLLRLDQAGRDALAVATDAARLAADWADDAHRAPATPPLIAGDRLTFARGDAERIEYTIRPRDLLREVRRGDKVRRETYRLPPHASARFETTTEAGHPVASIVIRRDPPGRRRRAPRRRGRPVRPPDREATMIRPRPPARSSRRRRALVSVALLIALFILGLVAAALLEVGLARRALGRRAERQHQVDLLADSGIARALARLDADPGYAGETWTIPADDLGGRGTAVVQLELKADAGARLLIAVAEYRTGPSTTIRQSRSIRMPLSPSSR